MGPTIKLFVFFPPTEHNLKALDRVSARLGKLAVLIDSLEGGCIALVDKTGPIYIPAGWLHAVVTVSGGPMFATNIITMGGGPSFLRWLRMSLSKIDSYDRAAQSGLVENILSQLSVALNSPPDCVEFLRAWIKSAEAVARLPFNTTRRKQVTRIFEQFFQGHVWADVKDKELEEQVCTSLIRFRSKG